MHSKPHELTEDQELRSIYRIQLVSLFFIGLFFIFVGRSIHIQVVQHEYYTSLADKQYVGTSLNHFDRGTIFFSQVRDEPVPAAQLIGRYRIAVAPGKVKDAEALYRTLTSRIVIDKKLFDERLQKLEDPYEEIASGVSEEDIVYLKSLKLPGVTYVKDNVRFYPQGSIGSQVIGFVGNDGSRARGQYGVERYYEDILSRATDQPTVRESVLPQTRSQTKPVQKAPQIDKNDPMNYAASLFEECDNKFGKNVPVYSGGSSFVPSVGGSSSVSVNGFSKEEEDMFSQYEKLV
jgi:cell division protein FtsI/penicillin-binding protein 2